ncbi:MAG: HD-GYP domain-containing protein [Phycisphaerales bacterium]|nr:HD-GYP domain-containing protein [Phycisphaerales bacterium]
MSERATIESSLVALAGVVSLFELYGDRHAATLRQADDAARLLSTVRGASAQVRLFLMPGKVVCDQTSYVVTLPACESAILRLIELGATLITVRSDVTMLAVLDAVRTLRQGVPAGSNQAAPLQFGRTGVRENAESSADSGSESGAGVSVAQREAIDQAWRGIQLGDRTCLTPLLSMAGDIATAAHAGAGTILPMARLADYDEYTFSHTVNVGLLASALATEVGLSKQQVEDITVAALLHDIGKLQVPKLILNKEGPLDKDERSRVMRHPVDGAALLYGAPGVPRMAAIVAFEHHMNLDGTGYPIRRRRWRISAASEIVHIADVFDALRTHRPYRKAMELDKALGIMRSESGVAFDPELFKVFADSVVKRAS